MAQQWILDLPPNNPKEFGKAIEKLAEMVFCPCTEPSPTYALIQALGAIGQDIDYSTLRGWIRGKFSRTKQGRFYPHHFQMLIEIFWNKPNGLSSGDELRALAYCAGAEYVKELENDWVLKLVGAYPPKADILSSQKSDYTVPPNLLVQRTDWLKNVREKMLTCSQRGIPLVLYGVPGIGKTCFIKQLSKEQELRQTFSSGILVAFLNGKDTRLYLEAWHQDIFGNTPTHHLSSQTLANNIRRKIKGKRYLILIDDVSDPNYVNDLMVGDTQLSLTVVTTASKNVARVLAPHPDLVVECGGYSLEQSIEFCRTNLGDSPPVDNQEIRIIHDFVRGNPLGLHFALHVGSEMGWQLFIKRLKEPTQATIDDMMNNVLHAMKLGYDCMDSQYQECVCNLGLLPHLNEYDEFIFQALFSTSEPDTQARMALLKRYGFIEDTKKGEKTIWHIHRQVHLFAQKELQKLMGKQETSDAWLERAYLLDSWKAHESEFAQFKKDAGFAKIWRYARARAIFFPPKKEEKARSDEDYLSLKFGSKSVNPALNIYEYMAKVKLANFDPYVYKDVQILIVIGMILGSALTARLPWVYFLIVIMIGLNLQTIIFLKLLWDATKRLWDLIALQLKIAERIKNEMWF
jgi:hypothetical protein